jgi:predicted ATP-binding protein involved in virulence
MGDNRLQLLFDDGTSLPSLEALSLGQWSLLSIFSSILMYNDNGNLLTKTEDMVGIVVVDEVDSHLHIDMQTEVLAGLMKMFPKVQFILSAHSPILV